MAVPAPEVVFVQQAPAGGFAYAGPHPPAGVSFRYPPPPPDPQHHHRVGCHIAGQGPLGLQLVDSPSGAGSEVLAVAPGSLLPTARPGDRLLSVGGVDVLMRPPQEALAVLQGAPRPLTVEFLRRNAASPGGPDDPTPPVVLKDGGVFAALPPDPSQHHMVPCTITRPGVLGLGLSPAPGGAGVCVDMVAPDTAVAPPPQKGDRVHTVAGADMLMVR
jgi:hypothetical protein